MSEFFKFLSRKGGKAPPRAPVPANNGLGDKVLPAVDVLQEAKEAAKEALDGKQAAIAEPAHLILKLADFIARIPPHLRKQGEFDPERPLSFEMGWIMGRINRGLSTVPLAKLLDGAPDLFTEAATSERDLEIRFPWRRVAQLLRESESAEKKNGGETLAQKFRRHFQPEKMPAAELIESAPPVEALPLEPSPVKGRGGRAEENVWYTRNKTAVGEVLKTPPQNSTSKTAPAPSAVIGKNGGRAGATPSPVPDSAPALMELPSTEQQGDSIGAQFPAPSAVAARHGATPAADLQPSPDLMDLMIGPEDPAQIAGPAPTNERKVGAGPPEVPDSAPALMELEPPGVALANPEANAQIVGLRHGKSRNEMRIADLEARLSAITVQHRSELSALRAESERAAAQARADATKFGREGAANFHAERKRIAAEKDQQLARIQTDLRAVIEVKQNEITELRAARKQALSERQKRDDDIAQLMESREVLERENQAMRDEFQKALVLTQQHESAAAALRAEHQSALAALETSRRDDAKALDEIKAESEREIATLRAAAGFTALEMEARFKHERGLLLSEKDKTLATMEAEHRAALATRHAGYSAARDGHEKERTDLAGEREAAERRWGVEREMLIKEKASLAAEYEQRLSAVIAEHQKAGAAFDSEASRNLTAAETAKHEEKMARQAAEHERVIDELQKEAGRKTSELQAAFEDERQRIRAENEGATATTAASHAATLAGKEAEIGLLKNEMERVLAKSANVREKAVSEIAAERDGLAREKEAIIGEHAQRLESIAKQHEDALGALRTNAEQKAAEAEAARLAREAEIARLQEDHRRALADQAAAHEKAAAQGILERDGLSREKEAVIAEHAQRIENITKQHQEAVAALRTNAEQKAAEAEAARVARETEIARLKEEHERAIAEQAAAHEKAAAQALLERDGLATEKEAVIAENAQRFENITKQHQEAVAALRTQVEQKAAEAEAARVARETEITRLKAEHERALAEQAAAREKAAAQALLERDGLSREKEAVIAEHARRIENITKEHQEAVAALRTQAEQKATEAEAARIAREAEIARLKGEHERALAQQAAVHEKAAAQALLERDGLAREKDALVAEHAQRLDNITKEAVQALRSQAEQRAAEAEAARASREAEIARLKEEHRRALAEQAAAHQNAAAQALLERGALAKEKEAVVAEHAQQIAHLATKQADLHAKLEAAKSELHRSAHLLRLQEQNASEVASKHELDLLASGLESAQIVEEQKEKAEKELADLKNEHDRALAESVESRARALADAATERESLARKMEADLAERDRRLAAQMKEHQEKLAGKAAEITLWKSEYAGAVDASATACQKLIAERNQLEREKEAVIREREDRLAKLTKKHETALAAFAGLRADFDSKHSEMDAAMASRNEELAALRAELEATRTSLTVQRDDAVSESAARAEELEMRNRGAEQFAAEVAQYRERIKTVLAERTALAERLEKERRVHAHAIQGGKEAMERLHTEHDRAAAEQAEKHRNALSGARAEAHQAVAAARAELERDRQEVIAARSSILREITARAAAAVPPPEQDANR